MEPISRQLPQHATAPRVVLDTNAWLDLWWFGEPSGSPVRMAIESGRLAWVATPRMLDEIAQVAARPAVLDWPRRRTALAGAAPCPAGDAIRSVALARRHEAPPPLPATWPAACRCRDAADQIFVELAVALAPVWLITRDRALLRMRRAMQPHGVTVATPAGLAAALAAG